MRSSPPGWREREEAGEAASAVSLGKIPNHVTHPQKRQPPHLASLPSPPCPALPCRSYHFSVGCVHTHLSVSRPPPCVAFRPSARSLGPDPHPSVDNMSDAAPKGSSKAGSKPDNGGKKSDDKIIVKVAGVVVATGIAWSLYKSFNRPDHPLVNTEKGLKKDAENALDSTKNKSRNARDAADYRANQTKGGIKDAAGNLVHKLEDVGHKVQGTFQRGAHVTEDKAQEGKDYVKDKTREGKEYIRDKADQVDDRAWQAKKDTEGKSWGAKREAENKGWGAKNDFENKANEAKHAVENKADEAKQQSRGFWGRLKGEANDTEGAIEDKSKSAKGAVEEKGREAKGAFKDAGNSIKGFAQDKKEQAQDAGNRAYEKGAHAKKRIDGKQVTIQKGDTLWGLARKYNVSVESLKAANGIIVGDALDAGDIITIPSPPPYNK